jgi:hypothetical protein
MKIGIFLSLKKFASTVSDIEEDGTLKKELQKVEQKAFQSQKKTEVRVLHIKIS